MSNSSFTGVSNEDSLNRISASSADISTIRAGIINCDSVQISLPKTAAIVVAGSATHTLTSTEMSLIARGDVLYQNHAAANGILYLNTVDTAAEALRLLALFNIPDASTTRIIKFNRVNAIGTVTVGIGTSASTFKYVMYSLNGANPNVSKDISLSSAVRPAYVMVYSGVIAGTTEKTIIFDVIGQALT